jgi:hypothetical protein
MRAHRVDLEAFDDVVEGRARKPGGAQERDDEPFSLRAGERGLGAKLHPAAAA